MNDNYQIIECVGFDESMKGRFTSRCDHEIKAGWVPVGSPFIYSKYDDGASLCIAQAMWKPLDKEERDGRNL